ncbi:GLPGLI family protein [Pseudarcicella hirudinis]|nr:GLPGLI family protein [Pseudarcicella hirudinis]
MMKKIVVLLMVMSSFSAISQTNEGVVKYTRTTYWTKLISQLSYVTKQEKDKMSYMFGGRDDWKEYMLLYFNENGSRYTHSEEKSDESEGYDWGKQEFNINRNFEKNTMTDLVDFLGKGYLIEDSLQTPKWKILNDLKDVAGHICMKAMVEDTVKKQKIIAWFAQDIPLNAGPERLYGLPGMILELDINDGAVIIEATKIELKKLGNEMDLPKKLKGKKLTEKGYQEMLYKFVKEKTKEENANWIWMVRY